VPLFEPVRLRYFDDPPNPWFVWLADEPTNTIGARVVKLVINQLSPSGCPKEAYVLRALGVVHVFDVYSHCRRWARGLTYTTDTRYTLVERQPSLPPPCAEGDPHEVVRGPKPIRSSVALRTNGRRGGAP
jgi:hypothetical protein